MQLVELQFDLGDTGEWLDHDLDYSLPPIPRAPGIHVSGLIRHIENQLSKKGYRPDSELTAEEIKRIGPYREMGFIWERLVERILADRLINRRAHRDHIVRQSPLEVDGIHMTPDALDILEWITEEYKATWRSMRRAERLLEEFWQWIMQMKGYCKGHETNVAHLYAFFVNGNYRASGPMIRHWQFTWTQQELDDNWGILLQAKEEVEELLDADIPY